MSVCGLTAILEKHLTDKGGKTYKHATWWSWGEAHLIVNQSCEVQCFNAELSSDWLSTLDPHTVAVLVKT